MIEWILRHTIGRATLRAADRVLYTSADYGRASHSRSLLRGRESHVGVLPNGVDVTIYQPGKPDIDLRVRHAIADDAKVVLLVASLDTAHFFKGVNVFLTAHRATGA